MYSLQLVRFDCSLSTHYNKQFTFQRGICIMDPVDCCRLNPLFCKKKCYNPVDSVVRLSSVWPIKQLLVLEATSGEAMVVAFEN